MNNPDISQIILTLKLRENTRCAGYIKRNKDSAPAMERRDIFRAGYMEALDELMAEIEKEA